MKSKRLIICVIIGCLLFDILMLSLYKYGWKIFGYQYCVSPQLVHVTDCEITDRKAEIRGIVVSSAEKVDGLKYHVKDNTLYIGIHCKIFWASTSSGSFHFSIETESQVNKIVLTGEGYERVIYPTPTE